jgi:hypothetical protein
MEFKKKNTQRTSIILTRFSHEILHTLGEFFFNSTFPPPLVGIEPRALSMLYYCDMLSC